jgi:hypothetical protein
MQFADNPGVVASGPKKALAAGALKKLCLGLENMVRHQSQGRFPGHRHQEVVTLPAAAQRSQISAAELQAPADFCQLALGVI